MISSISLHSDCLKDATATLRQPVLRDAIAKDDRMRARLADRLAEEQGLPAAEDHALDAAGRTIAQALSQDAARLVILTGLLWNAKLLAQLITREALAPVMAQFDRQDVIFAQKLKDFAPPAGEFGYEAGKLKEFIEAAGMRCLVSWLRALPQGVGGRLRLSLPRTLAFSEQAANLDPQLCADLLLLAARNMIGKSS